ncbi:MAG: hypothetical protein ACREFF_07810 [Candidatus Udaeobacter sp.]
MRSAWQSAAKLLPALGTDVWVRTTAWPSIPLPATFDYQTVATIEWPYGTLDPADATARNIWWVITMTAPDHTYEVRVPLLFVTEWAPRV